MFLPVPSITSYFHIVSIGHSTIDLRIIFIALHTSTRPTPPFCGLYWDVCEIVTLDVIIAWPRVYVPIWSNRATDLQCTWCNGRISDRWSDGVWFREPSGLLVGVTKLLDLNREEVIGGEFDGESWNFSDDLVWFETLMVLVTSTFFCFRFTVAVTTFLFSYCCTFVCIATDRLYWSYRSYNRGVKPFTA